MYRLCGGATLGCCMGCGVLYCDGVLPIEEPLLKPYVTSLGQQTAPPAAVVHHLQCQGASDKGLECAWGSFTRDEERSDCISLYSDVPITRA